MVSNRILLFGGNGQVGRSMQRLALPSDWQFKALGRHECDFTKPRDIATAIQDYAPDLVINAAAMTDIDACERDPDLAREVNFHAVAHIAGQCAHVDAPFIHISTDYVFDGRQTAPYGTQDAMNPVNVYGQTKMLGEEAARHGLYWHVILRTSYVFSPFGNNALRKTLNAIDSQDEVRAASDQSANPTSATALAQGIVTIADAILHGKGNGFGTFHLSGETPATRFEFLQAVMDAYAPLTSRRPTLQPVPIADMTARVPRPACSILNNERLREVYGIAPHDWRVDLVKMVGEIAEKGEG